MAPGLLYGIDHEASQVRLARRNADAQGLDNTTFQVEDAASLPFPDNHFDAVHCHDFLPYTLETTDVFSEAVRALRPGGIFAAREMDLACCYIYPAPPDGPSIWKMIGDVTALDGGRPLIARALKAFALRT